MMTESVVIIISFLIVSTLLFKRVSKLINNSTSQYCNNIEDEIIISDKDKESSQTQLESIMEKNVEIEGEVGRVLNAARLEAKLITNKRQKEIETAIENKLQEERDEILYRASFEVKALKEQVINISADCTYKLTTLKLSDKKTQSSIINFALEQVITKLH